LDDGLNARTPSPQKSLLRKQEAFLFPLKNVHVVASDALVRGSEQSSAGSYQGVPSGMAYIVKKQFELQPLGLLSWIFQQARLDNAGGFLLHFLSLIVGGQRLDQRLQLPIHNFLKLMDGQANAVVRNAVLRKVVSPDLLAAVA